MKAARLATLFAGAVLAASIAQAAPPRADLNGDRRISPAEFRAFCREAIMRADVNHDGRLDRAEWDRAVARIYARLRAHGYAPQDPHGALFHIIDSNNDGAITPAEIDVISSRWFMRLDSNHSGYIERRELGQRAAIARDAH